MQRTKITQTLFNLAITIIAITTLVSAAPTPHRDLTMDLECSAYGNYRGNAQYRWTGTPEEPRYSARGTRNGCTLEFSITRTNIGISNLVGCQPDFFIVRSGPGRYQDSRHSEPVVYDYVDPMSVSELPSDLYQITACQATTRPGNGGGSGGPHGVPEFTPLTLATATIITGLGIVALRKN